jgi:hypothetical protein
MHKRIQELAEQTGFRYDNGEWQFGDDSDVQKFAELIVKECATMVFNSHPEDLPFVGGKMLVHFGIKE